MPVKVCAKYKQMAVFFNIWLISGQFRKLALLVRVGDTDDLEGTETFMVSVIDAALAAQNMSIAAESMGLGICYIGPVIWSVHLSDRLPSVRF